MNKCKTLHRKKFMSNKKIFYVFCIIFLFASAVFYFLGCGEGGNFSDEVNMDEVLKQSSTVKPTPIDGSTPDQHNINDNYYFALSAMQQAGSFIANAEGVSITKAGITVKQEIKSYRQVNGKETFKQSLSYSGFKSVGVELYVKNNNYVIRDASKLKSINNVIWQKDAQNVSEEAYFNRFGAIPNGITSYIFTDETIINSSYLGQDENGLYMYKYELDPEKSTLRLCLEMRTMAGTRTLPIYEQASVTIYINKDWKVLKTVSDARYKVDMLGGVTCNEHLTETFSAIGEKQNIPNADYYGSYIGSNIIQTPVEQEPDATYYLTSAFGDYISGTPLNVNLNISSNNLKINGYASINIDMENMSNISAKLLLNEISINDLTLNNVFIQYKNNNLYICVKDLKLKVSVEELPNAISKLKPLLNNFSKNTNSENNLESTNPLTSLSNLDFTTLLTDFMDNLAFTKTENNIVVSTSAVGLNCAFNIEETDGKCNFKNLVASFKNINVTAYPVEEEQNLTEYENVNEYNNLLGLLNLIDENGIIKLNLDINGTSIDVNFNLNNMILNASTMGANISVNLNNLMLYANYSNTNIKCNLNEIDLILNKIKPILNKFLSKDNFMPFNLNLTNLNINDILSSIKVTNSTNFTTINLKMFGADLTLNFNTVNNNFTFSDATICLENVIITATESNKILNDLDTTLNYTDLKLLVEKYADAILNLLDAKSISLNLNGTIISTEPNKITTLTFENAEVNIVDLWTNLKLQTKLTINESILENGKTKNKTHNLEIIFNSEIIPTECNVYINYNGREMKFSTEKLAETKNLLMQIYNNIPELQDLLKNLLPINIEAVNKPTIDFSKFINNISLDNYNLKLDLNASSILNILPASLKLDLLTENNNLTLKLNNLVLNNMEINLQASTNTNILTEEEINSKFTFDGKNASDFSSMNELLKTIAQTSQYRHFSLSGQVDGKIGLISLNKAISIKIDIDVIKGKTYVVAKLERKNTPIIWNDYDGSFELFYNGQTNMIYTHDTSRTRKYNALKFRYDYTTKDTYSAYTIEEFTANLTNILLNALHFSKTINDQITKSMNSNSTNTEFVFEEFLQKYSYSTNSDASGVFTFDLNLKKLTNDALRATQLNIHHNVNYDLTKLDLTANLFGLMDIIFTANLATPLNQPTGAFELVNAESNSNLYLKVA